MQNSSSSNKFSLGLYNDARILLISPITPLHAGAGSSPATVDLPIQRDPLGYPIIYVSSIKGALKTQLWRKHPGLSKTLLGPEPDDEEKYTSPLALIDANLLFIPARSTKGILMVTSPHLLRRAYDLLELLASATDKSEIRNLREKFSKLIENMDLDIDEILLYGDEINPSIVVAGIKLQAKKLDDEKKNAFNRIIEDAKLEKALPKAYGSLLPGSIAVLSDYVVQRIIERSLIRQTRVRIDRSSKTVSEGGLWTEEYLPPGALLLGGLLLSELLLKSQAKKLIEKEKKKIEKKEKEPENDINNILEKLKEFANKQFDGIIILNGISDKGINISIISYDEIFGKIDIKYLVLGGKESTGKGIAKTTILPQIGGDDGGSR